MPGDDLKKVFSGEEFAPSAKTWNHLLDAARDFQQRASGNNAPPFAQFHQGIIVPVKNDTGADIAQHGIIHLEDAIITPTDSEEEFRAGIAFSGTDSGEENIAVYLEPVPNGEIGQAVISGAVQVKIDVIDESQNYARGDAADSTKLVSAATGPAFILWREGGTGEQWAVVRIGNPQNSTIRVGVILADVGYAPNQLYYDSGANPVVRVQVEKWDIGGGSFTVDFAVDVVAHPSFKGAAFAGDRVLVYQEEISGTWYAVAGGNTIIRATNGASWIGSGGSGTASAYGNTGDTNYDIAIDNTFWPIPPEDVFLAIYRTNSASGGEWWAIGPPPDIGCGLEIEQIDEVEGVSPAQAVLKLDLSTAAGDGLTWDAGECELNALITCAELATAIPCCITLCADIQQLKDDVSDLIQCCIDNTACCTYILNNCCDSGSDDDDDGDSKNSAIVPASWTPGGYAALFVEESPEVRFDDVLVADIRQQDTGIPVDFRFLEVCEPGTIEVTSTSADLPVPIGARVGGGSVLLRFPEQIPDQRIRVVVKLSGIRKGFCDVRFPNRTRQQFQANEEWIRRAYPGGVEE